MLFKFKISVVLTLVLLITIEATLAPKAKGANKKTTKQKEFKVINGPQEENVFDRNLVEEEPASRDIISDNAAYYRRTDKKLFNGTILGYVTPWNNHGYDVAKIWGPKFDVVSPVWLQILRKGKLKYEVGGTHDIDAGWVKDVRKYGRGKSKILPRILFDQFNDNDFSNLLTYPDEREIVVELIHSTCLKHKFDGVVLEVWTQLAARVDDEHLITLVTEIADKLKSSKLDLILVIPPIRKHTVDLFTKEHFETLYPVVTSFSLMTYDYSSIQKPGANAPLYWVRNAVEFICPATTNDLAEKRKKILMGMNMYGSDFTPEGGGAIIGQDYLNLVRHVKGRLQFDEKDVENFFEVKTNSGRHYVFYPTLFSINERIKLATELGTGISLWEIGQGLDYFYDLF